jgi:hypothetical protein
MALACKQRPLRVLRRICAAVLPLCLPLPSCAQGRHIALGGLYSL